MACTKHPLRKRKDCPDCFPESKGEYAPKPKAKIVIEESVKAKPSIEIVKKHSKKSSIPETPPIIIKPSKPEEALELNKILKDEITEFIKKEVRKLVAQSVTDILSEEAIAEAKITAGKIFDHAIEMFSAKIRPLTNIQYEHLTMPLSVFNVDLLYKLQGEGWCYKDMYRGEVAKACNFKCDTVVLIRVKNDKWPPVPKY